jgi:hypothetical protein
VKNINSIKPEPLVNLDRTEIRRDIFYTTFKKGVLWTATVTALLLILFVIDKRFGWGIPLAIRDVTAVFTCGIVLVTCFYHAKNLRLNVDANQKKLDFDYEKFVYEQEWKDAENAKKAKKERELFAFNISKELSSSAMGAHMHAFRLFYHTNPLMAELKTIAPNYNTKLKAWTKKFDVLPERVSVILVLNYFENTAIAIEKGLADEDICKEALKTVVCQAYQAYKIYIDYRQNEPDKGSATFFEHFEKLAIKWSNGTFKSK